MNKKVACAIALGTTLFASNSNAEVKKEQKTIEGSSMKTDLKIRMVNAYELSFDTKAGKKESEKIQNEFQDRAKSTQTKKEDFEKRARELERKKSMLTDSARENEQTELVKLQREIENSMREMEQDYKMAANKATERISKEITKSVAEIAKADDIDIVVDMQTGRAIYVADTANYTDKVKDLMDKNFKEEDTKKTA